MIKSKISFGFINLKQLFKYKIFLVLLFSFIISGFTILIIQLVKMNDQFGYNDEVWKLKKYFYLISITIFGFLEFFIVYFFFRRQIIDGYQMTDLQAGYSRKIIFWTRFLLGQIIINAILLIFIIIATLFALMIGSNWIGFKQYILSQFAFLFLYNIFCYPIFLILFICSRSILPVIFSTLLIWTILFYPLIEKKLSDNFVDIATKNNSERKINKRLDHLNHLIKHFNYKINIGYDFYKQVESQKLEIIFNDPNFGKAISNNLEENDYENEVGQRTFYLGQPMLLNDNDKSILQDTYIYDYILKPIDEVLNSRSSFPNKGSTDLFFVTYNWKNISMKSALKELKKNDKTKNIYTIIDYSLKQLPIMFSTFTSNYTEYIDYIGGPIHKFLNLIDNSKNLKLYESETLININSENEKILLKYSNSPELMIINWSILNLYRYAVQIDNFTNETAYPQIEANEYIELSKTFSKKAYSNPLNYFAYFYKGIEKEPFSSLLLADSYGVSNNFMQTWNTHYFKNFEKIPTNYLNISKKDILEYGIQPIYKDIDLKIYSSFFITISFIYVFLFIIISLSSYMIFKYVIL